MEDTDMVLAIERGFWTHANDPDYFREHMAEGGLSAIEPTGVIEKAQATHMVSPSPWSDVVFSDVVVRRIGPDVVVLAYHGEGRNPAMPELYHGAITSTYVRDRGAWRLALTAHQPWSPGEVA